MAKNTTTKKSSNKGTGFAVAATLSIAAGLAGAALLYMRKRGIKPSDAAKSAKKGAQSAAHILSGESKAAYDEIRAAVMMELAKSGKKITKPVVFETIDAVLAALKKHGHITKQEMQELAVQMKAEWKVTAASAAAQK